MAISHIQSLLVHAPNDNDPGFGDLVCPIHLTTTYKQEEFGKPIRYDYSRGGNPSRQVVEDQIAVLEGGNFCDYLYGDNHDKPFAGGLAFSSGMAAITAVLSLFNPGDEILVPGNLYGGTFRILDKYFARFGLRYRFVDFTNLKAVEQVFTDSLNTGNVGTGDAPSQSNSQASPLEAPNLPNPPKALLFESPTNPLLEVANIAALAKIAQQHGAITIVDNTFMSPYLQRPLQLGANIVIHSATKYLGGHSDVLAGLVAVNNRDLYERLHFIQYSTGATLSAFDSYLLARGIKTLALRLDCACDNALKIAQFLDKNEQIAKVAYPGLPTDPGYAIQQSQASNGGALLAFELAKGLDAQRFVQALKVITLAESLGAVESLICHPASMTHASIPAELRAEMGITDGLLRLSVGIEHKDDLCADIEQALRLA